MVTKECAGCGRPHKQSGRECSRCKNRRWRKQNVLKYTYNNRKNRAKQRGKFFNLSLEEWKEFCDATMFLYLRGKRPKDMSVDCIIEELGYVKGNIQMITNKENNDKERKRKLAKYKTKTDDCPF